MATFKCKMCGGTIEIAAGTTVIECEYCGTSVQWNAITKGSSWNHNTGSYTTTYEYTEE